MVFFAWEKRKTFKDFSDAYVFVGLFAVHCFVIRDKSGCYFDEMMTITFNYLIIRYLQIHQLFINSSNQIIYVHQNFIKI